MNQNKTWTNDTREDSPNPEGFEFQSKEGMKLTANVGMKYCILAENVPDVFETYKKGADEITNKVLRNATRDAFNKASSTRTAEQMYGEGKVAFMKEVDSLVKSKALEKNITVIDIYLIGNIGIPNSVTQALNRKIEANQRAEQRENELREAKAEAEKKVANATGEAKSLRIKADAEAYANRTVAKSLSPALVEYKRIEKWNGITPTVTSGNALIDLRAK